MTIKEKLICIVHKIKHDCEHCPLAISHKHHHCLKTKELLERYGMTEEEYFGYVEKKYENI